LFEYSENDGGNRNSSGVDGMIVVFENQDGRICFCFFTSEQWDMINDVSCVTDVAIEETIMGVIQDMPTVVFLDPEDL
jgi:WD40 repeat protein